MSKRDYLTSAFVLSSLFLATSCSITDSWLGYDENEAPLPGKRVSILTANTDSKISDEKKYIQKSVQLPTSQRNTSWTQVGGGEASNNLGHLAGGSQFNLSWKTNIGPSAEDGAKYVSMPILADGKIFVMNLEGEVKAVSLSGKTIWSQKVVPSSEETLSVGGGIAYEAGNVYALTKVGEVVALSSSTGEVEWTKKFSVPFRGAPIVKNGKLYAVSVDNETIVLDSGTGELIWNHQGISEMTTIMGGSAPVIAGDMVLVPHSSGELCAYWIDNGELMWVGSLTKFRAGDQFGSLADIVALPIVDGEQVIAANHMNKLAAFDMDSGTTNWSLPFGTTQTPVVADDNLFVVTSNAKLYALSKSSGQIYWSKELQSHESEGDASKRLQWFGPLLVNQKLVIVNNLGHVVFFDAQSGKVVGQNQLPDNVSQSPIYVDGTYYFVGNSGNIMAYRTK